MTAPVLLVTNHAPPERVGAFQALHERMPIELALFGGRSQHATAGVADPGVPHRHVAQGEIGALVRHGRWRAVIASSVGRRALPAAWLGARRSRTPFVLWTGLWAHPLTPAHALSYAPLRAIYATADAIATYGPHVSAYVRAHGARGPVVEAPQAVDGPWWGSAMPREHDRFTAVFVGREARAKGVDTLIEAWSRCGPTDTASLILVGVDPHPGDDDGIGIHRVGHQEPAQVRNFLARSDVLVLPSRRTRTFREPWGLVANEAMNQRTAIITTDAVGAAAGGLVRDGHNGLVVPAGERDALAEAMRRLAAEPVLRTRLGETGAQDVRAFTYEAWAEGFSRALATLGLARERW
jgi:glycosyltransferase involved in cell wall biosynthesis